MQRTTLAVLAVPVLALALASGVVAADDGAVQDDTVTIELHVTTPDGEAVGNADATIEWDGDSVETTTRSNGRAYEDVPAGADLEITLEHESYVRNVPHTVSDVESGQVIDVEMHPPATLALEISDDEGGLEDANVRLTRVSQSQPAATGATDADGTWSSGDVEEGDYRLRVVKPGYYVNQSRLTLEDDVERSVVLESGRMTLDLRVRDPTIDETLASEVVVEREGEHQKTITTDDSGTTGVSLDVNTRYELTTEIDGYRSARTAFTTGESDAARTINVSRTESITLEAANERVVVGENLPVEVYDEYDRPVEGATVSVDGEERGETDADGEARVPIDTEGEVTVTAAADGLEADPVTVEGITAAEADADGDEAPSNESDDDGDDGSPGFGVVAGVLAALLGAALLARRD